MNKEAVLGLIRTVAEQYIREYLPEEHPFFLVTWSKVVGAASAQPSKQGFLASLLKRFTLAHSQEARLVLVSPKVILTIIAVMEELGKSMPVPPKADFTGAVKACACSFGMKPEAAVAFSEKIAPSIRTAYADMFKDPGILELERSLLDDRPTLYAVWTAVVQSTPRLQEAAESKVAAEFRAKQNNYQLFVDGSQIAVHRNRRRIDAFSLGPNSARILMALLVNRKSSLSPRTLYAIAASRGAAPIATAQWEDGAIMERVKPLISRLRDRLKISLPEFSVNSDTEDGSYKCSDSFSFCIVLPAEKALLFRR